MTAITHLLNRAAREDMADESPRRLAHRVEDN
jgi:hypothetical protein